MNSEMMMLSIGNTCLPQAYRHNQGRGHWRTPVNPKVCSRKYQKSNSRTP